MSYDRFVIDLFLVRFCMELGLQPVKTIPCISNLTSFYFLDVLFIIDRGGPESVL